jgi:DNA-binding Xre family transcriptional regulator
MPTITLRELVEVERGLTLRSVMIDAMQYAKIREESFYAFANNEMKRYPADLIDALCAALDCEPSAFIERKRIEKLAIPAKPRSVRRKENIEEESV